MKKCSFFSALLILILSNTAFAAGYHYSGDVQINPAGTYMGGFMNVRYNTTAANSPYLWAAGAIGGDVTFFGRDINNRYFACVVQTTSSLYQGAVDIKNNLQNGSYLSVYKATDSNECTYVFIQNGSPYLD